MSASNVRNIESLELFQASLVRLASDWDKTFQEIRMVVQRADSYFNTDLPAYWRRQTQLAERELSEAKDNLSTKRSAARASDRPAATEAVKRVQIAEKRVRTCHAKRREAKHWALEMSKQCDDLLGPLADVMEHSEVLLPNAAKELSTLIEQLKAYAEQGKRPS